MKSGLPSDSLAFKIRTMKPSVKSIRLLFFGNSQDGSAGVFALIFAGIVGTKIKKEIRIWKRLKEFEVT